MSEVEERKSSQALNEKIKFVKKMRDTARMHFPFFLEENNKGSLLEDMALGKKIGQIIQLPNLPEHTPKGFNKKTTIPHFLLTKERFDLCKELIDFAKNESPFEDGGFVPSGPHGIGKSSIGLLLASYAFVNGHYTVYIPKMRELLSNSSENMAYNYLSHFLTMNADLITTLPPTIDHLDFGNLLVPAKFRSPNDFKFYDLYEALLKALGEQTDRPVTNIIDEHNEIFKSRKEESALDRYPDFLEDFTKWTGKLSGRRNFTVFIGSAHSKFERNLPGGAENRLRYLQPLQKEEALVLLADKGSSTALPEIFFKNEEYFERLEWMTGLLPRELVYFREAVDEVLGNTATPDSVLSKDQIEMVYRKFRLDRTLAYKKRLDGVVSGLSDSQKEKFYLLLSAIINPRYAVSDTPSDIYLEGAIYDQGLFFRRKGNQYQCISGLATKILLPEVLFHSLRPIFSLKSGTERGLELEKWIIHLLWSGKPLELKPIFLGTKEVVKNIPSPFQFCVDEVRKFKNVQDIIPNSKSRCLYVPEQENFPTWDCIFDDGKRTVFISISMKSFWSEHFLKTEKGFGYFRPDQEVTKNDAGLKSFSVSQVSSILDQLRGIKDEPRHQVVIKDLDTIIMEGPSKPQENAYFFFLCGLPLPKAEKAKNMEEVAKSANSPEKEKTKKKKTQRPEKALCSIMRFVFQEQLADIGVKF